MAGRNLGRDVSASTVKRLLETEGLPPAEACTLDPAATEFPFAPWVFLHLVCWDGSSDLSGAVVHIPVSRKTYTEGHSE